MASPLLEARQISKSFAGVRALKEVSLSVYPGEVLAVIGENGAGKSTLMKILAGVQAPDSGSLLLDGTVRTIGSVQEALSLGIALIHQELNLAETLDVGANIESDAAQLVEFAIMGEAFMTAVHGVSKPTIGILNVGSEDMKGHEDVREAARLLREGGDEILEQAADDRFGELIAALRRA